MKKMPAKGRTAKPSGMLAKLLGQAPGVPHAPPAITQAHMQAQYEEAMRLYNQADWSQAEAQADALLAQPGLSSVFQIAALNLKATLAARTHRLEEAVRLYRDILSRQPGHVDALSNQGLALQKLQRHEEALTCLAQAVKLNPGHANSQLNLGLTYQSLGRPHEARCAYQRALAIEPGHLQALFNIAKMLQDEFDFEGASRAYQAVLDVDSRHADALANLIFVQHYRYPPNESAQQDLIRRVAELSPPPTRMAAQASGQKSSACGPGVCRFAPTPGGLFFARCVAGARIHRRRFG